MYFALFAYYYASAQIKNRKKLASWRKDLPDLLKNLGEEESNGDNNSTDVHQAFSRRYSPASFDSYSPDNDKELSEFDKDSSESNTGVSKQSEVGSSTKKNRKKEAKGTEKRMGRATCQ